MTRTDSGDSAASGDRAGSGSRVARDKVALITGAGRQRVGGAVAAALAGRGYAVALHYNASAEQARQSVARLKELGVRAAAIQADVADPVEVDRLFDETIGQFGRLDVLVTSAAVWRRTPLEEVTAEEVRRQFDVNTLGTLLCCRRAGLIMAAQPEGGVIVTVGDWATRRPYVDYAAYFASKGALPTLTRCLAVELARRNTNVRVNCILPGPVMLPDDLSANDVEGAVAGTLLKRAGRPENVAQAVLYLIDNDYVTGTSLPVDGGRTIG